MTPLAQWRSEHVDLAPTDKWSRVPIEVDLTGAVTLVLDVAASIARGDREGYAQSGSTRITQESDNYDSWSAHHEPNVHWNLRDSLDGDTWHLLDSGTLDSSTLSAVARISTPVGTQARISFRTVPMLYRRPPDDEWRDFGNLGMFCNEAAHSEVHSRLRVPKLTFNVAVRSI